VTTPTDEQTPRDLVKKAVESYNAIADLEPAGVGFTFLAFPTMYHAAIWAHSYGIESSVRLVSATGVEDKNFDKPVRVIFEF